MRPMDERGRPIGASPGGLPAGDRGDPVGPGRGDPVGPGRGDPVGLGRGDPVGPRRGGGRAAGRLQA